MNILERLVLLLGASMCIGAFFLPYIEVGMMGKTMGSVSGYDMVMGVAEAVQAPVDAPDGVIMDTFAEEWSAAEDFADLGKIIGAIFFILGPFFFALYGLSYLIKALRGKSYRQGVIFTILFTAGTWIFFYFMGPELGSLWGKNFFKFAGLGFWIAFAGMWVAAISLFFSKNV
ncbi:MAG: hypothetical protein R3B47_00815 [Bacteroidia bacterium]